MKINDVHIGASPLSGNIYVGTANARNRALWNSKVDRTSEFIGAVMEWCPPGSVRLVNDNTGASYEIEVRLLAKERS